MDAPRFYMVVRKISTIKRLPKVSKLCIPYFSGYRVNNIYYSHDFYNELRLLNRKHPISKGQPLYSIKIRVSSSNYLVDCMNREIINVFDSTSRLIAVGRQVTPLGYKLHFDDSTFSLSATLYFVKFDLVNEVIPAIGDDDFSNKELTRKIEERVLSHFSLTSFSSKTVQQVEVESDGVRSLDNSKVIPVKDLINFTRLLSDPEVVAAMQRCFKGLPVAKASELCRQLNNFSDLSGQPSAVKLHIKYPTKIELNRDIERSRKNVLHALLGVNSDGD